MVSGRKPENSKLLKQDALKVGEWCIDMGGGVEREREGEGRTGARIGSERGELILVLSTNPWPPISQSVRSS